MRELLPALDPGLVALFGGTTRSRTLAVLSSAAGPMTGYRVAVTAALQPIKTYEELRRLQRTGIVSECMTVQGRMGWELTDEDLRKFFKRRMRISWFQDWDADVSRKSELGQSVVSRMAKLDPGRYRSNRSLVSNRAEFERPAAKDRALRRVGLRASTRRRLK